MGLFQNINGQLIETGQTQPQGLAVGRINSHRKLIQWNLPNDGLVEMYVNPQSLSITEGKILKETRTKGGYIIQYWGEKLPEIDLQGTTGSGGIEGINVLRDIYRQEQIAFSDIISNLNQGFLNNIFQTSLSAIQNLSNNPLNNAISSTINNLSTPDQFFKDVVTTVGNVANVFDEIGRTITTDQQLLPTLGALATSVELWYDGVIYRGFFREFRVDEKSDEIGLFRYTIKFVVTRQTGIRLNGFAWQRTINAGPANSDVIPLSFGGLQVPSTATTQAAQPATNTTPINISRRSLVTGT